MRTLACVVFSLLGAACASDAPREKGPQLPLHIAIAPLSGADIHADRKPGTEGDPTEMHIDPTEDWRVDLSKKLKESLEFAFARVSLLDEPKSAPGADPVVQRDTQLLKEANAKGADLLLCLDVSIQPNIREKKNEPTFWLNLPLYLLGGPFGWFLPDHSYFVEVQVSGRFYVPRSLHRTTLESPLRDTRPEVESTGPGSERMDLDFFHRAQGVDYLLGCLIPSGFLAATSDTAAQEIATQVANQLGTELERSVLGQRNQFVRGTAPFFLDVEKSKLETDPDGEWVLHGSALLRPTREIESLGTWTVQIGDAPAGKPEPFDALTPVQDGEYLRYNFDKSLGKPPKGTAVRLEIEAGERTPRVRSYTFCVRGERPPTH